MNTDKLSPVGKKFLSMIEFDDNEVMLREIRKDPFGLFMIYLGGLTATMLLFSLIVLGASAGNDLGGVTEGTGLSSQSFASVLVAVGFFLSVGSIIITAVAAYLYKNNVLLVTSEKVCQMLYVSLFNRKISQLSIADVQDVSVKQQGIFAHMFNYGTITIETAGEQQNYTFTFTPEPYEAAKILVGSHESDVAKHGN